MGLDLRVKKMEVRSLAIPDVKLITPRRFGDDRGYFEQTYHQDDYKAAGIDAEFVQDNHSKSVAGVLRGLHYQRNNPQAKLVSVLSGAVFDVAVDLRQSSPHYGQWVGAELSSENGHQLFVPAGFAHGFLVLSEEVNFYYKCDAFYTPGDEVCIRWDDTDLAIEWPLSGQPSISDKDSLGTFLADISADKLFD
mgnify:CR=1 FL=1|jgi:dTDP-4-dehydrorhamnose 3,5-epimerase